MKPFTHNFKNCLLLRVLKKLLYLQIYSIQQNVPTHECSVSRQFLKVFLWFHTVRRKTGDYVTKTDTFTFCRNTLLKSGWTKKAM